MRKAFCAVMVATVVSGCAMTAENQALMGRYRSSIPVCQGPEECELKWAAARRWVQNNAGLRIQNYSDDYIQTHKSGDYANTLLGVEVNKEPLGGGRYQIVARMWVNNAFSQGGIPSKLVAFNDYVNTAMPMGRGGY